MQKEEIIALLDQLYLDQEKYNKFTDYVSDFVSQPRCKKGIISFIEDIFNLPEIAGKNQLAIQLLSSKTTGNSLKAADFIFSHPVTKGYNKALVDARLMIMTKIAEYILEMSKRIQETTLEDRPERQVYLRRAVARLITATSYSLQTWITAEQWAEVEPYKWTNYLTTTLEELTDAIKNEKRIVEWSDTTYAGMELDNLHVIRSLSSYLDYLETFLVF